MVARVCNYSLVAVMLCCILAVFMFSGCGVEGLHGANPKTIIRVDPVSREAYLYNNKDVNVSVDEVTGHKGDSGFAIKNLRIVDNASSVRLANVEQMHGYTEQAVANWAGAAATVRELTGVLSAIIPLLDAPAAASALGKLDASSLGGDYAGIRSLLVSALKQRVAGLTTQPE